MNKLYYTAPLDGQFEEVKRKAIAIWQTYDFEEDKIAQINGMKNVEDNFMYIVAMFDENNQKLLFSRLTKETQRAISDRIRSANPPHVVEGYYKHLTA